MILKFHEKSSLKLSPITPYGFFFLTQLEILQARIVEWVAISWSFQGNPDQGMDSGSRQTILILGSVC